MKDLLVCIGNMGSYEHLGQCLGILFEQTADDVDFQVRVGFNGFRDPSVIERMQAEYPQVEWLFSPAKLGYTGAYNKLMQNPGARYVLLLDDDTRVPAGSLRTMVAFMDAHPEVGLSGCRVVNPDGTFQKSFGVFPDLGTEWSGILRPAALWPPQLYRHLPEWKSVDWVHGTFMLVRDKALEAVGALDEQYFTYVCEADWAMRMKRAGWDVVYVGTAVISHVGGEHSTNTLVKSYPAIVRAYINRFYFQRKFYSTVHQLAIRPALAAAALVRALKFLLIYLFVPARRSESVPKLQAFIRVSALALQRRPWKLPHYLQRENDVAAAGAALAAGPWHRRT
jgi:GT2 family glycosyltransferase